MADSETELVIVMIMMAFSFISSVISVGGLLYKNDTETLTTPTINIENVSIDVEQESAGIVEKYNYGNLSRNVNIIINWTNGNDFGDVTNMYFIRKRNGAQKEKKEVTTVQRMSGTSNTIKFTQGENEDMRGTHNFVVTYKLRNSTTTEHEIGKFDVTIKDEDITLSADTIEPVDVVYKPITVAFGADVQDKRTVVTLVPDPSFGSLYFIPSGANNSIKIQRTSDDNFLKNDGTFGASGDTFYVQSATHGRVRISTTDTDSGKLLTHVGPSFKKYTDMNPEERIGSLFTLTFTDYIPPPCSTYDGSWSQCEPYFDRCQYDWHAPTGQPKCIPIGQALTPAPACSTYTSSFTCDSVSDRCHWDPYNIAGARCVPLATALTPAPPTGVCSVRTAKENNYFIQNMTAWAGDGMLTIATTKCNQRTTQPTCTSTSDNVFGNDDGISWNLYNEGYRNTKYNDVCKWVEG